MLRNAFRVTWTLLDGRGRRRLGRLFGLMAILALLEVAGVGSILPFVALLIDPALADRNPVFLQLRGVLGIETREGFVMAVGVAVTAIVALVNVLNTLLVVGVQRFTWGEGARLAERLFAGWLAWPWVKQTQLHSAEVTRLLFGEVTRTISNVFIPLMTVSARGLAILAIALSLVFLDPVTTALTLVVLGGCYVAIFAGVRRRLAAASAEAMTARAEAHKIASETFGGLKDVRIYGAERLVRERFRNAMRRAARFDARAHIASQLPRYVLETAAFGGLAAVAVAQLASERSNSAAISVVATFAFAGYRVLPALQQTYAAATLLRSSVGPAAELAETARALGHVEPGKGAPEGTPAMRVTPEIRLDRVAFAFPGATEPILSEVSLVVPPKSFVLVVGETGSGKTTLIDLIAGLLEPSSGRVLVDGEALTEDRLPAWRARLGYVSQAPMILDDTIAANVAFPGEFAAGDESEERLRAALAGAQLDRALGALPDGPATRVGERGGRLSGGQRQRLAIARALYRQADVMILDESTSALDEDTERAVLDTLAALRGRMTILIISHRPAAHSAPDLILRVRGGTVAVETPRTASPGKVAFLKQPLRKPA